VLNNFNYGMTGGQCSSTTPQEAVVGSGFLNRLEKPIDICQVAGAAGAPWVERVSTYQKDLVERLKAAIEFDGFSLVDIWGVCPGRYTRRNKLTPKVIETDLAQLPPLPDFNTQNARTEYGKAYRREAAALGDPPPPVGIEATCAAPHSGRQEIVILGSAGQRIITAGELLCLAAATAGCHATQKNDYPITVMKGHSVSEVIMDGGEIDYTGIETPSVVIALAPEGVNRRRKMLETLSPACTLIKAVGVELPPCEATIIEIDFKARKIKAPDWALAALAVLAGRDQALSREMLTEALKLRFNAKVFELAQAVIAKVTT
jgi:Pyruvate/2-oxoacid:ferredoxin oxidoreductase gamma subunit